MQARKTIVVTALAAASALAITAPTAARAELRGAVPVTGTSGFPNEVAGGSRMWDGQKIRGESTIVVYDWAASDPRLTGELTVTYNSDYHERQGLFLASGLTTLQTAGGDWAGEVDYVGGPALRGTSTMTLERQGPYERLTAYVAIDQDAEPITFSAAILPGRLPAPPVRVQRTSRLGGR